MLCCAETRESVSADRSLYLQATIVRILKMRKQITHAQLVAEVIEQSRARFVPPGNNDASSLVDYVSG